MLTLNKSQEFLDNGFSLLTVGDNKQPNIAWKPFQTEKMTAEQLSKSYHKSNTHGLGYITGYNNIEVFDIDLKVLPESEREPFWSEYVQMLDDNIEDFYNKFVIYRTKNNGYHIIYRCAVIEGNKKVATPEGIEQALIETRGKGGYCFIYEDKPVNKTYFDIQEVSEEDREILFSVSKIYDYKAPQIEIEPFQNVTNSSNFETGLSCFKDYNNKTSIWSLISSEFTIVKDTAKRIIIKRLGALSAHSGYIFKDSNILYLFSSGTRYTAEVCLSASDVFAIQTYFGDKSKAAKDLYQQGYGDRMKFEKLSTGEVSKMLEIEEPELKRLDFPLSVFPAPISDFVNEVSDNAGFSKDFLSVSIISSIATIIGKSCKLKVNNTWFTSPIFWFAIVGAPGSKKSHPVKFAINPLKKIDTKSKEGYDEAMQVYDTFMELEDKEKKQFVKDYGKQTKPEYKQLIIKDSTIEALFHVHDVNKNGIMLYKDELIGWINAMGQYKGGKGDEMEKYLSMFDGDDLKINRVTKEPLVLDETSVNLIGTIQPAIVSKIPKDNGLLHRFLFTNTDSRIKEFSNNEVSQDKIDGYRETIMQLQKAVSMYYDESLIYEMSPLAKKRFIDIDLFLCNIQKADDTEPIIIEYCEKLKTYTPRFALILAIMNGMYDDSEPIVNAPDMDKAFDIIKYFLNTAKLLFFDADKSQEVSNINNMLNGKSTIERILELKKKGFTQKSISQEVGKSKQYVSKVIKSNQKAENTPKLVN